jgi:hypothetical protein
MAPMEYEDYFKLLNLFVGLVQVGQGVRNNKEGLETGVLVG